jgi:hypothetical protein
VSLREPEEVQKMLHRKGEPGDRSDAGRADPLGWLGARRGTLEKAIKKCEEEAKKKIPKCNQNNK